MISFLTYMRYKRVDSILREEFRFAEMLKEAVIDVRKPDGTIHKFSMLTHHVVERLAFSGFDPHKVPKLSVVRSAMTFEQQLRCSIQTGATAILDAHVNRVLPTEETMNNINETPSHVKTKDWLLKRRDTLRSLIQPQREALQALESDLADCLFALDAFEARSKAKNGETAKQKVRPPVFVSRSSAVGAVESPKEAQPSLPPAVPVEQVPQITEIELAARDAVFLFNELAPASLNRKCLRRKIAKVGGVLLSHVCRTGQCIKIHDVCVAAKVGPHVAAFAMELFANAPIDYRLVVFVDGNHRQTDVCRVLRRIGEPSLYHRKSQIIKAYVQASIRAVIPKFDNKKTVGQIRQIAVASAQGIFV